MRDLVKSQLFFALILCGADAYAHDEKKIAPQENKKFRSSLRDLEFKKSPPKAIPNTTKSIKPVSPPSLSSQESEEPSQSSTTANSNSDKTEKPLTLEDLEFEEIPAPTKSAKSEASLKQATKPQSFDTKELFKRTRESVVLIMSFDSNNQPLAIGSGFYVDDGKKIATNRHVISGAQSVRIKKPDGKVFTASIVLGVDSIHDLALLKADVSGKPIPLSQRTPEIGEDIIAIGNPKGLEATLSKGIVSGVRNDQDSTYYQVTAPISPGSSGGPIIDGNGEVVGVSTFYVQGGQNLNFAMPAKYIKEMLRNVNPISVGKVAKNREPSKKTNYIAENVRITEPECRGSYIYASALNLNSTPIKNVRGIAIFYPSERINYKRVQKSKYPVHYKLFSVKETIPSKLALRFSFVDSKIECDWIVKIRILDYDLIHDNNEIISIPTFE